jgi:hypothetical protein
VVILSQCVTKMRPGAGAVLVPAINNKDWEQGLGCRVVLFRDWGWNTEEGNVDGVRLAEVIKAEGAVAKTRLVGFTIQEVRLILYLFFGGLNIKLLAASSLPVIDFFEENI